MPIARFSSSCIRALLVLLAVGAVAHAAAEAQIGAPVAVSEEKTTMERDRAVSQHLAAADREHARQLFADGYARGQKADLDGARAGFEEGLAIDPANAPANYFLGYVLLQQHEAGAARARFARTVYFAPKSREGTAAKAALAKLTAAEARSPLRADMTGACRPLVESFTAAAQKNNGPATKAAYEALHDAGGCGIANDPPVSAAAAAPPRGASAGAKASPGTSPAAMAATYARLVALGLQVAQEIESATQPASAGSAAPPPATAAPRVAAAAPKASNQAAAASNPFASSNNAFAAKTSTPETSALGSAPTPASVQITVPPMDQKCRGLVDTFLQAGQAQDAARAANSYAALKQVCPAVVSTLAQQAGVAAPRASASAPGSGESSASSGAPTAPSLPPGVLARPAGSGALSNEVFARCSDVPLPPECTNAPRNDYAGPVYDPAQVLGFAAEIMGAAAEASALAAGTAGTFRAPSYRGSNMNSLAAPPIRNGVGQGAPVYRPPANNQSTITGIGTH
jgi:hypothetical protein